MLLFLIITAVLLIVASLTPLSNSRRWYVRALDFPRFQIACLSSAWLAVYLFSGLPSYWALHAGAVLVAGVLLYQFIWIFQYTQLHDVEMQSLQRDTQSTHPRIRILSSNVLMHNTAASALLNLVEQHRPDVLITLETNQWWQDQLDILDDYPHRLACPLENLYGMHVYSRLPLHNPIISYLVEDDKPSMSMQVQLHDNTHIQLYVLHPAPPAPNENLESIERDVELLQVARSVAGTHTPIIVAGDLNDVAWSATTRLFRQISGLLDPRVGRGFFNTFHAHHWFLRWPLDHVFASEHFKLLQLKRLPKIGSDHFPLLVELALSNTPGNLDAGNQTIEDTELLDEILDTDTAERALQPVKPA